MNGIRLAKWYSRVTFLNQRRFVFFFLKNATQFWANLGIQISKERTHGDPRHDSLEMGDLRWSSSL